MAIPGFFAVLLFKATRSGDISAAATASELEYLKLLAIPVAIILGVLILIGAARVLIGVLDLVPRKKVSGVVMSVTERKMGDFLPYYAQKLIFHRDPTSIDKRRSRTEVVLRTNSGDRQWTVRSHKMRRSLTVGSHVQLTVSPLVGYVAQVEPLGYPSNANPSQPFV